MEAINPTTGETIQTYDEMSPQQVEDAIEQAHEAFLGWHRVSVPDRAALMQKAAQVLRDNKNEFAKLMAEEMGKVMRDGRAEVQKCAWVCEYYAENAEHMLQTELVETEASKSFVTFQPLGVVLAVMPWNFPFWQVFRFAAPGLMAGNAGVLKHASNVPGCALAIEDIFREAGFPENLFRTLLIGSKQVETVIEHPLVKAATLTGSTPAGRAVARKAGDMLKKTVLELGGSDPYVILEDADLEESVATCVNSRLINAGQSCIAAKRFIVVESLRKRFEKLFVEQMRARKMGDPMDEETQIGPQARHDLRDQLHKQVEQSIKNGAQCLLGGNLPDSKGAFYPPTVLTNVKKGMPAYEEEMFGPVAAIIRVSDDKEAIRVANDSVFGLGAAVFTRDVAKGENIATNELEAGCCFVNAFVKSDPRLPFGGVKESGYGRELSHYGIKEFVNIKTVYVK
ncbi:NAD-dependent succinate-semialdehyde dehydrogenase [candidate division KSB1 bacterium]|nr:NAD-dependent succinate-semialdehyde dehydrogenase [candidate division KSB1 bacterium]NIR73237.1 NAD-dependent succinate-semialdehyde dehydrogenase [candidate division KSB1 bacterium]NIS28351.1 NAD-dependent succinate-semialdehyde dehydrogenase [candidate division KSB1 bacterium]NIT74995.1 NAD-dependent succinate-semialdehyde dehydrogenase [candidate division KSB1 bacterium]NIU29084.1 NAD-dependent succinate-semialdehyde dehydrogenase [candidate division KSB1 bacterium]